MKKILLFFLMIPVLISAQLNDKLQSLAKEFWQWRFITQPATMDDINRVERPDNWKPDFSDQSLESIKNHYKDFSTHLNKLNKSGWSRADSVDFLCLRSAIERVNWEINILKIPYRNPDFYVQQTIGAFYELLVMDLPFDNQHTANLLTVLKSIPQTLADGKENLIEPAAPFANIALENLNGIKSKLLLVNNALKEKTSKNFHNELDFAFQQTITSLEDYQNWLNEKLPVMKSNFGVGKEAYVYFLKNIALIPYTPEEILKYGRMEFNRAASFELIEKLKNKNRPRQKIFSSIEEEIAQVEKDEIAIRDFLVKNEIVSVPEWLRHYEFKKTPEYLKPLTFIGESDDFTSENRLNQNAVRYTVQPDSNLPFFPLSIAKDPRPIIIHEGIPGHFFQLARSWKNSDPIRRRFVDSGSNEGIGFYVEEMLLQYGLFDDRPFAKEIIYSFMRLRALRVEADIQLALGNFTIEDAVDYLMQNVPLDKESALESAYFYAYNPGQAISYQIGKIQLTEFLSESKIKLGAKFNLKDFHDYVMMNGNVPISLLRWEYLGLRSEINQFFEN
ncbi:MAG: DUF885 family protein [Ignavibacteriales bacterium]|nr:DUF885 family protein [Ignavibacteriales bacterium]